jgi:hypothetical protein
MTKKEAARRAKQSEKAIDARLDPLRYALAGMAERLPARSLSRLG